LNRSVSVSTRDHQASDGKPPGREAREKVSVHGYVVQRTLPRRITLLSSKPFTIPALKTWSAGNRNYLFGPEAYIACHNVELAETAHVFAEDVRLLSGLVVPVVQDVQNRRGAILLTLDEVASQAQTQGYRLEVAENITISAPDSTGVFYGTRTVLQLLKQDFTSSTQTYTMSTMCLAQNA
jgi:hypothetical protein